MIDCYRISGNDWIVWRVWRLGLAWFPMSRLKIKTRITIGGERYLTIWVWRVEFQVFL